MLEIDRDVPQLADIRKVAGVKRPKTVEMHVWVFQ